MDLAFTLFSIAAVLLVITLISNILAYIFTEVWTLPIKPFNCYGCLSFWFTLAFGLVVSLVVRRYFEHTETRNVVTSGVTGIAFLLGIINYLIIKLKFKVYE